MASATDNFNRANGGVGTNWTSSINSLDVSSNAVKAHTASNDNAAWWNANTFSGDHSSQLTFVTAIDGGGPTVRNQASGANFYLWYYNATSVFDYYRVSAGAFTLLGASVTTGITPTGGSTTKLSIAGTTLTGRVNTTDQATRTDSTYSGGAPGIHAFSTNIVYDDWVGDPIATVAGAVILRNLLSPKIPSRPNLSLLLPAAKSELCMPPYRPT